MYLFVYVLFRLYLENYDVIRVRRIRIVERKKFEN